MEKGHSGILFLDETPARPARMGGIDLARWHLWCQQSRNLRAMEKSTTTTTETRPAMIEAHGLSKFYGDFAAVRDVSFKVYQGEVVAFLGPNGAGKSTTMKLLTGYLSTSTGVAKIAGHDMASDRLAGSTKLGYLPENGPLYPDMTPR